MRRLPTFTLALVAAFFTLGVPSAVAGGPTSVLIANYQNGRSAAALNGSATYTELQAILGAENPPAASSTPPGVTASEAGVRLVWLIHDVSPWRIDTVHLVGPDVWVETYMNTSGSDPYAGSPTWHQPARGADLLTSLTALGVLGAGTTDGYGPTAALGAVTPVAPTGTVSEPSASVSWQLAAGLIMLGVLLGLLVGRELAGRGLWHHSRFRRIEPMGQR